MLKRDRQELIRNLVETHGRVAIEQLKKELNVSEVTIRKDLSELESLGQLIRVHGGAASNVAREHPRLGKKGTSAALDNIISVAKCCVDLIPENKWVYLSSGLTCYEMSKFMLNSKNLNIVTSGLSTAINLAENKSLSIFVPGGNVNTTSRANYVYGDHFLNTLGGLSIDVAFCSFVGIDINSGFSVDNANEFQLVEKIREVSKKVVVPVDSSKFGVKAFMTVAPLTYADVVVTNSDISDVYRSYFAEHGIELVTTD